MRATLRRSVWEGAAFSTMVGAGESYLAAFALTLRASAQEIAWLASLPPLIGSGAQLASAWLARAHGRRRRLLVGGALAQALCLTLALAAPALGIGHPVVWLLGCVVAYHVAGNLVHPAWASLMSELVPPGRRGRYFANRNRVISIATFVSLVAAGAVLHAFDRSGHTLLGFAAVFSLAVAGRVVSAVFLGRMHDPDEGRPPEAPSVARLDRWLQELRGSPFLRFSIAVAAMLGAVAIAGPFFAVLMLRDLGFSYLEFTAVTASSVLVHFLTLNAWGRIGDRFGNRVILICCGCLQPLIPGAWLISTDFWFVLAVQTISGLAWGGFNLSAGNYLYDVRPGRGVAGFMAVHSVIAALAVFAGASVGGVLAETLPSHATIAGRALDWHYALLGVFAISAVARGLVVVLLLRRITEVRAVAPARLSDLVFRMARYNSVSVLAIEVVAAVRREVRRP